MSEIFDVDAWRQVFVSSVAELGQTLAAFLPKLVATLVILVVGWLVSRLVAALAERVLRQVGLDRAAQHVGVSATLARAGGVPTVPSRIVAQLVFWVLMLTFLLSAVETLGLTAVTGTIDRLIGFLPNLIAAALLFLLGLLLARLVRNVVSSGAAAADLETASRLGALAETAVAVVAAAVALEQIGIETSVVVMVIAALLGTLAVTLGVGLALGARPVVTQILAGHFLRQSLPPGGAVEVAGHRGVVERVGAVDTLLRHDGRAWSIPNQRLLEEIVLR
jgi:small-conductance mechanosensitive channel